MFVPSFSNKDFESLNESWTFSMLPEAVDDLREVVRMMQVVGRPPIIVLGTIGNLLTFITMQRGSLKRMSTCFYMAILGLADTGKFSLVLYSRFP